MVKKYKLKKEKKKTKNKTPIQSQREKTGSHWSSRHIGFSLENHINIKTIILSNYTPLHSSSSDSKHRKTEYNLIQRLMQRL